ncbi:kynurenine--oxoglutarate transaminase 3-like isoform X2 [Belonocnema kinseyi]|uniref:kynurenine--oxoglutarate transaminase 3-like isoform X2 n=1 Tax=Belonocnema kinseyi TaxID=2817044 RepID=UPI00143DBFD3|nr:kynurenine--oxoglutarate transaminase 3-like isoform X2 [Belonocnema kinseyi]
MSRFGTPDRFKASDNSVWVEYRQLSIDYKPVNLGQGYPDFCAPKNVTKALANAALSPNPLLNQYTRAFKKTSDTITSADWLFDKKDMEKLFNEKTKGIIINTPHNPIGKVFTLEELQFIANLAKRWNTLVVSDEVYEWIVYEPKRHIRIATLPDMFERTITIGSAGKTFSVTGWKIGWAYGPENLLKNLKIVHQNSIYTCVTPIQEAVAVGFEEELARFGQPDSYFVCLKNELLTKRDFMAKFLTDVGMSPTIPEGGYFMVANWIALENKVRLEEEQDANKDYRFTKWMIKNVGVLGMPSSTFYCDGHKHLGEDNVRYCFIKDDENLKRAAEILLKWKSQK